MGPGPDPLRALHDMTTSRLPVGTVTFLFSDIEASTRLAESLAERWPAVLERHREIVRAALRACDGLEVQTEGDGFFAVFATAPRCRRGHRSGAARPGRRALAG